MKRPNEEIFAEIKKALRFLEIDYGFVETDRWDEGVRGAYIVYENATTAVAVLFERREQYAKVDLWRLADGKGPRNARLDPIYVRSNRFALAELMAIRVPSLRPWTTEKPTDDSWFGLELHIYADFMREHSEDILRGDFSAFGTISLDGQGNT